MKSLMQYRKCCYICGTTTGLHKHHIFYGTANRSISEKYGCWCYLCYKHHTGNEGVHFNPKLNEELRKTCQEAWEEANGSTEEFIKLFGRNYK